MADLFDEVEQAIRVLRDHRVDIEAALEVGGGTHTFDDVATMCLTGQLDLHVIGNSILICELVTYPQKSAYNVFVACGNLDELLTAQGDYLAREAAMRGASVLTVAGRKGWLKPLTANGWEADLTLMHKELANGQE